MTEDILEARRLKRYLLFAGENYYPSGGALDLRGSFDFESQAREALKTVEVESYGKNMPIADAPADVWWHIYDSWLGCMVAESKYPYE